MNPVKEHLEERLIDVERRIATAKKEIRETENTTRSILKILYSEVRYEDGPSSDDDPELYTVEGHPVIKKRRSRNHREVLMIEETWKRVFLDKWIIGFVLRNVSTESVEDIRLYADIDTETSTHGWSILWRLIDDTWYTQITNIEANSEAVATLVLDLPNFQETSVVGGPATIYYKVQEKEYQVAIQGLTLSAMEATGDSCTVDFTDCPRESVLTVKSVGVTRTLGLDIEEDSERGNKLLELLGRVHFEELCSDVFVVPSSGCLMYSLVEILPRVGRMANIRISSRSESQLNVLLRLLMDQLPELTFIEQEECQIAASALLKELEMYADQSNPSEIQRARIRTDLLIP